MKVYDGNIFESIFVNVTLTDAFFLVKKEISRQFFKCILHRKKIAHCMQLNDTLKVVGRKGHKIPITNYFHQWSTVLAFYAQQPRIFFSETWEICSKKVKPFKWNESTLIFWTKNIERALCRHRSTVCALCMQFKQEREEGCTHSIQSNIHKLVR